MKKAIFVTTTLIVFMLLGCDRSDEESVGDTASVPNESVNEEPAASTWAPINVEEDRATGLEQLVPTDRGFRRWEWSLRDSLHWYYPGNEAYEAIIGLDSVRQIHAWTSDNGTEPARDETGVLYLFDQPGRLVEYRQYSLENGFWYERYSYDEAGRLEAKETRTASDNTGWDNAQVAPDLTVEYEYFEHPGYPDRIYRVAMRPDGGIDRVVYEEETGDSWQFTYDGRFGGWTSFEITTNRTTPFLTGQIRQEFTRIHSVVDVSIIGTSMIQLSESTRRTSSQTWNTNLGITYVLSDNASSLLLAEHRNEREGTDEGVTQFTEHDGRGNWLRATRVFENAVQQIIVREIEYMP